MKMNFGDEIKREEKKSAVRCLEGWEMSCSYATERMFFFYI